MGIFTSHCCGIISGERACAGEEVVNHVRFQYLGVRLKNSSV